MCRVLYRTSTFRFFLLTLLVILFSSPVRAGWNAGGVLVLHADPDLEYTTGQNYCDFFDLDDCAAATTNLPMSATPYVWWLLAAFPERSTPRLLGTNFGIGYDSHLLTVADFGSCGNFELPDPDWPESLSGTAIVWDEVQRARITPVYWFAGYTYYATDTAFFVADHPSQGPPVFADDSFPSILEPVAALGSLGFNGDPGSLPCPDPLFGGACCLNSCECLVLSEAECDEAGGTFLGDSECSPAACGCPPSACCLDDGSCQLLLAEECEDIGGELFPLEPCVPNPCPAPRTGRCCVGPDDCRILIESECAAANGDFGGEGSRCRIGSCPGSCDPVPQPSYTGVRRGSGPNVGGVLIIHQNPEIQPSTGQFDYCGESGLFDCESAVIRTDVDDSVILHVLAAFPPTTNPSFNFVGVGILYPTCISVLQWGSCGDEGTAGVDFPDPGTVFGVGWNTTRTDRFIELAWLAVEIEPNMSGQLALGRVTDAVIFRGPGPVYNEVADFGAFGFFEDGYSPCREPGTACCFSDGSCEILTESECESAGGSTLPDVGSCDPNPCEPTPTIRKSWGEIKHQFGH